MVVIHKEIILTTNKKEKTSRLKGMVSELKKVIWPTPKQLVNNTIAVLVIVVITAVIVLVLDLCFNGLNSLGINKMKDITGYTENSEASNEESTEDGTTVTTSDGTTVDASTIIDGAEGTATEGTETTEATTTEATTTEGTEAAE